VDENLLLRGALDGDDVELLGLCRGISRRCPPASNAVKLVPRLTGPKGTKSAALSLRLTPRTRFGLALLARVNRLSLGQVL